MDLDVHLYCSSDFFKFFLVLAYNSSTEDLLLSSFILILFNFCQLDVQYYSSYRYNVLPRHQSF